MLLKDLKEFIPDLIRTKEQKKAQKPAELSELQLALLENNKVLQDVITQSVMNEIRFLFQANDRQEEDRYKKLDTLIRQQQQARKEYAKAAPLRSFRKIFEG